MPKANSSERPEKIGADLEAAVLRSLPRDCVSFKPRGAEPWLRALIDRYQPDKARFIQTAPCDRFVWVPRPPEPGAHPSTITFALEIKHESSRSIDAGRLEQQGERMDKFQPVAVCGHIIKFLDLEELLFLPLERLARLLNSTSSRGGIQLELVEQLSIPIPVDRSRKRAIRTYYQLGGFFDRYTGRRSPQLELGGQP